MNRYCCLRSCKSKTVHHSTAAPFSNDCCRGWNGEKNGFAFECYELHDEEIPFAAREIIPIIPEAIHPLCYALLLDPNLLVAFALLFPLTFLLQFSTRFLRYFAFLRIAETRNARLEKFHHSSLSLSLSVAHFSISGSQKHSARFCSCSCRASFRCDGFSVAKCNLLALSVVASSALLVAVVANGLLFGAAFVAVVVAFLFGSFAIG